LSIAAECHDIDRGTISRASGAAWFMKDVRFRRWIGNGPQPSGVVVACGGKPVHGGVDGYSVDRAFVSVHHDRRGYRIG
jgi:hypothetical protein